MYLQLKRQASSGLSSAAYSMPRPTVKRQRGEENGSDEESEHLPAMVNEIASLEETSRTLQHDGRWSCPASGKARSSCGNIIKEEEPDAMEVVYTETEEGSFTIKEEEVPAYGVSEAAYTEHEQHRRRRAAPSSLTSTHVVPKRFLIDFCDIPSVIEQNLVSSPRNPGRCPCGQYQFYAVCSHAITTEAFKCGARRSQKSGAALFCASPAPRHIMDEYLVNQPCRQCFDPPPADLAHQ